VKLDVLLGLQWGDEGKGKVVDVLTPKYDVIARFQGGPNAGHSIEFNDIKHVLHTIPSGIFHQDKVNIIGNGVVIDPVILRKEIESLKKFNLSFQNLYISRKAHFILPTHRLLDAASEAAKGATKIGSTLKGIGPTYMDKTGRNGLRVGDILAPNFLERYEFLKKKHIDILKQYDFKYDLAEYEADWFLGIESLKEFQIVDSEYLVNSFLLDNKSVLAEGAQGTLLDIDFGSYPYVTSSNTICAGACTGLGVAPNSVGEVLGIVKAYCTRVGSGPFPTELLDGTGEQLRQKGHEFGATTGRPRRCGWLDIPALKYSILINGVTQLIMTKPDVLSDFDTIRVCVAYKIKGQITEQLPYDVNVPIEPVYKDFKGWKQDISGAVSFQQLPKELVEYIQFIEDMVKVPFTIISVGPDRKQTIIRNK
jgi:adenylosuccinate synthase